MRTFLGMARKRPTEKKSTDINEVASGALGLLGYRLHGTNIEVRTALAAWLPALHVDADQIGQVVLNLVVNAQQALEGWSGASVVLSIADSGPGVTADLCERIFETFFITKAPGFGTGLGLSVSRSILREHGGELRLREGGAGACFELSLPVPAGRSARRPARPGRRAARARGRPCAHRRGRGRDRLPARRNPALRRPEHHRGLQRPARVLDWLRANPACDFIISDIRMPDMDGLALWDALRKDYQRLVQRVAFVTGDALSPEIERFLREAGALCLVKPFLPEEVIALIARLEERPAA
ncbi:MAG: ATP-binding protein [Candidatus Protistobacter heckmanni]|nr:ATP-binding protein [Candidatus Protistobacter heckmanni]